MIEIIDARSQIEAKIVVHVTGAPVTPADYLSHVIAPDTVILHFSSDQDTVMWVCTKVKVTGARILKPATDGTQRLGKMNHSAEWFTYGGMDLARNTRYHVPEWIRDLIEQARPVGAPSIPNL